MIIAYTMSNPGLLRSVTSSRQPTSTPVHEDLPRRRIPPRRCGTELAFSEEVKSIPFRLSWKAKTINFSMAIFRQINKDVPRVHHDALEFPDGTCVLLTDLLEGQEATVLQLPAQPKTPAEEAAQRRVVYVG